MEEIKVGEYGRTNLGNIIKFAWFYNKETNGIDSSKVVLKDLMKTESRPFYYFKEGEHIEKHSEHIINILEEGDLVEIEYYAPLCKRRITRVFEVELALIGMAVFSNEHMKFNIYDYEWSIKDKGYRPIIKTILTKQQYQANCYEVK